MSGVLEISNLAVGFPRRGQMIRAVDGISLSVQPGEILAMVGESGAGKSLTGQAVLGLIDPPGRVVAGEIRVDGHIIDPGDEGRMQRLRGGTVGAVFQDPLTALDPLFTIGDQLIETLRTHHGMSETGARARAIALLDEVGIAAPETRLDAWPHEFSGGMRQRVVIALALAGEPKLIIADEPTTALDVVVQAQIIRLFRRLCRDHGTAAILITHDIGIVAEAADRVAVLYAGRLVEIGPVRAVLADPRHPYTQGLIASIPPLDRRIERLHQIAGKMPAPGAAPAGCAFRDRCPVAFAKCTTLPPLIDSRAACWREGAP